MVTSRGRCQPWFFSVLQLCRILARREDFSRSAAVCAEHQPQQVGRQGTPLISTDAGEVSGPLRLVLGGHSRAPWVAAPPLGVHRGSVVLLSVSIA